MCVLVHVQSLLNHVAHLLVVILGRVVAVPAPEHLRRQAAQCDGEGCGTHQHTAAAALPPTHAPRHSTAPPACTCACSGRSHAPCSPDTWPVCHVPGAAGPAPAAAAPPPCSEQMRDDLVLTPERSEWAGVPESGALVLRKKFSHRNVCSLFGVLKGILQVFAGQNGDAAPARQPFTSSYPPLFLLGQPAASLTHPPRLFPLLACLHCTAASTAAGCSRPHQHTS